MDTLDKLHNGMLYLAMDTAIFQGQTYYLERLYEYNLTRPSEHEKRAAMLRDMLADIGQDSFIEPPFHAN